MKILVDDELYEPAGLPDQTVAELANEICAASAASGQRMVVGLRCDGDPVAGNRLESVLQAPASEFGQLELQTQSVPALVRATLDQALEVFRDSAATRERAADLLATGQYEEAMAELRKFCEVWQQVQQTLRVSAQALQIDLDTLRVDDLGVTDTLDLVKTQLSELKDAMEQGDLVVVGDILRYEFDEPLARWLALLEHLREQTEMPEQ